MEVERPKVQPGTPRYTLETPNFRIHYHKGVDGQAQALACIAERVRETLNQKLQTSFKGKLDVVLIDWTDDPNGWASPGPSPIIFIYSAFSDIMGKDTDSLESMFIHEYTHALHFNQTAGITDRIKRLFGTFVSANALVPWFYSEGLATYIETEETTGGRLRNAEFRTELRSQMLEGQPKSLGELIYDEERWPFGFSRYIYGSHFVSYLSRLYGFDKLLEVNREVADEVPLLSFNSSIRKVYDKDLPALYKEWQIWQTTEFKREAEAGKKLGYTESYPVGSFGGATGDASWNCDGSLYFIANPKTSQPVLYSVESPGEFASAKGIGNFYGSQLSFSPDGRKGAFISSVNSYGLTLFNDIYIRDMASGSETRVTKGARARDARWSPAGNDILYIRANGNGLGSSICLISPDGLNNREIVPAVLGVEFTALAWSADGTRFAAASHRDGSARERVDIYDISGHYICPAYEDPSWEGRTSQWSPEWSPDGRYLLFVSDRSGVPLTYAVPVEELTGADSKGAKTLLRVGNLKGGALNPKADPKGRWIALKTYGGNGSDVRLIRYSPETWISESPDKPYVICDLYSGYKDNVRQSVRRSTESLNTIKPIPYKTVKWLVPSVRLPVPVFDRWGYGPGVFLGGEDPVGRVSYAVTAGVGKTFKPLIDGRIEYKGLLPDTTLYFGAEDGYRRASFDINWKLPDLWALNLHSGAGISLGYGSLQESDMYWSDTGTIRLAGQINDLRYSVGGSWPDQGTKGAYSVILGSTWKEGYKSVQPDNIRALHSISLQHNIPVGKDHKAFQFDLSASLDEHGKALSGAASAPLTGFASPLTGDRALRLRAEYHQPIVSVRKTLWKMPVYIKGLDGSVAFDSGRAWNGEGFKDGVSVSSALSLRGSALDIQAGFTFAFRVSYRLIGEEGLRFELPFGISF